MTTRIYFLFFLYLEQVLSSKLDHKIAFCIINYLHHVPVLYSVCSTLDTGITAVSYTLAYYMFELVYLLKYHLPVKKNNAVWYFYSLASILLLVTKTNQTTWLIIWNISCRNLLPAL